MVQAMINISEKANHTLNIVKAKYDLRNKSEAIEQVVKEYEEEIMELQLRPEYVEKLKKIATGKHLSREEFEKALGE